MSSHSVNTVMQSDCHHAPTARCTLG